MLMEEMERHTSRLEAFTAMQHEVLGLILARKPLQETLCWIATRMEEISEGGLLCSIFMMEPDGTRMKLMAAPGLPAEFNQAIDPLPVGEGIGSCGTAAARGEIVVIEDITTHPAWISVRELVTRHQLRACWSMPMKTAEGRVLGTMGLYHRIPRRPAPEELRWAEAAARLSGLAIERTQEAIRLHETGSWLAAMLESVNDAFFTLDQEWRFVTLNGQTERLLKRQRSTLLGRVIWEEFREAAGTAFEANCRAALRNDEVMIFEEYQAPQQRWLEVRIHPSPLGVAIYFRDVTAARQAMAQQVSLAAVLKEIAAVDLNLQAVIDLVTERARNLVEADGCVVALIEGVELVYCATSGTATPFKDMRVPLEGSLSGSCVREGAVLSCADTALDERVDLESCRKLGVRSMLVAPLRTENLDVGVLKLFSLRPGAFTERDSGILGILAESLGAVIRNHLTASRLKASEAQYRLLFDHNPHPMWAYDTTTLRFLAVNAAAVEHYGYTRDEFLSMRIGDLHPQEDLPAVPEDTDPLAQRMGLWRHRRKTGALMDVELSSDAVVLNGREARLVLAHDVTERRRSEQELARLNRAQRMLTNCNDARFREEDETALLHRICSIAVEIGNYRMAWIGFAHEDANRTIQPVAFAGAEHGFLTGMKLSWSPETPAGRGPGGTAVRTGQPVICEDILLDEVTLGWREEARQRGYRGIVCLPLKEGERSFGLLALYSARARHITPEEIRLLQKLADDTAFGILTLRAKADHARLQAAVVKVAASVSAASGTEFFHTLVLNMADALGAMGAVAGRLGSAAGESRVSTIAAVMDGTALPAFDYPQPGSPCAELLGNDDCVILSGVAARYPAVPALAAWGAEAYVGRLLRNAAGDPVGVLFVLFRHPLTDSSFVSSTLKIFAARAASELQRQEDDARIRQQASLLDKAQDAILVRDLNQNIVFWNQGAQRLYGWSSDEVVGKPMESLLQIDPARLAAAQNSVLRTGEWNGVIEKTTRGGVLLTLDSRWTLLRDAAGLPVSILTIDTDITEKRKLEQQFLRAQRMESIGTLAGGIAHDLNNVLAPIIMSIDLLKLTITDTDNKEVLDTIAGSAKRGASMVSQVLSFARGMEGRRAPVNARQLLGEIEKIARDTFPKNIRIQTVLPVRLETLEGDHTQLHQVLLNLCVNARDAMPDGGIITLSAESMELDAHYAGMNLEAKVGSHLVIKVQDTGSGMPPEILEKIFDPFFTTKEYGKGTGLGLSTSLAIIKSHDGFLRVYSEPGKGTVFRIYLPAFPEQGQSAAPPATETIPRGRGELILVIDDEASIASITRQTLESFGYRVMVATDGAEGVTLYAQHRLEIAAVLTDMMMPVMDGPSTIHVLMRMNPKVRIIAASGISSNQSAARAAGSAVREFLPKPFTAHTLLQTLRVVLDSPA